MPDPDAASLVDRGLKTLALRVRAQCAGAARLAAALVRHPAVRRVWYPGLAEHPTHALAERLLAAPGAMIGFELAAGDEAAESFVELLELALDAPSLGGVETIVSLPALMSHAHLTPDQRAAAGIGPGFVRVSVGIEHPDDLVRDFVQALDGLG